MRMEYARPLDADAQKSQPIKSGHRLALDKKSIEKAEHGVADLQQSQSWGN